jgi:hypothetical protein
MTSEQEQTAIIAPTGYGTWGIWWRGVPYMERRGGYSGPFANQAEAHQCIADWCSALDMEVVTEIHAVNPDKAEGS